MGLPFQYTQVKDTQDKVYRVKFQTLKERADEYFEKYSHSHWMGDERKRLSVLINDLPEIFSKPQNLASCEKYFNSIPESLEFPPIFKREFTLSDFIRLLHETDFLIHSAWYENIENIYEFVPPNDEQKRRLIEGFKVGKCAKMFSEYIKSRNGPMVVFIMSHYKNYAPSDIFITSDIESVHVMLSINQLYETYKLNVKDGAPKLLDDFGMFPGGFELGVSNPNIIINSCDALACHECTNLYTSPFVTITAKIKKFELFYPEHLYNLVLNVKFDDETYRRIIKIMCNSVYVKIYSLDILKIAREIGYLQMVMHESTYIRTRYTLHALQIHDMFYEVDPSEYTYLWDQAVKCVDMIPVFYTYVKRLFKLEHTTDHDKNSLMLYKALNTQSQVKYTSEEDTDTLD